MTLNNHQLSFTDIVKTYSVQLEGKGSQINTILDSVSFDVHAQEIFCILGPSGSGKSTLLRLCNRLTDATAGELLIQGKRVEEWNVICLRRKVGLVFQKFPEYEENVEAALAYPLKLRKRAPDKIMEKARDLFTAVGLSPDLFSRTFSSLSIGEQQRVLWAQVLMNEPDILLLDEPTSALDPTAAARMLDLVCTLRDLLKLTVVLVTHQIEYARRVADRVMILVDGKVVEINTGEQLFQDPQSPTTRQFLEGNLK